MSRHLLSDEERHFQRWLCGSGIRDMIGPGPVESTHWSRTMWQQHYAAKYLKTVPRGIFIDVRV